MDKKNKCSEKTESREGFHVADLFYTLFEQYSVTITVIKESK